MAEEEIVRIRATLDNADLKTKGTETVRTLQQVNAAVGQLPPALRNSTAAFGTMSAGFSSFTATSTKAAGATAAVGSAAGKAGGLFEKLRGPLAGAALGFAGVDGPASKVLQTLGNFALGGGITVAVAAGIALIVDKIRELGQAAREEREHVIKLKESLVDAAAARFAEKNPYRALTQDAESLLKRQRELTAELAKATEAREVRGEDGVVGFIAPDLKRAKELRKEITAIGVALTERALQAQDQAQANADAAAAAAQEEKNKRDRAAREAEQLANQRIKELNQITALELDIGVMRAKVNNDTFGEELALRAKGQEAIRLALASVERLSEAERERLRVVLETADAYQAQLRGLAAITPIVERLAAASRAGGGNLSTDIFKKRGPTDQRVGGAIEDPFGPGGAQGLINRNARGKLLSSLGKGAATAAIGGVLGSGVLGQGVVGGALGGALSGFASGGPVGALIGGVGGLIGGLFGGNKKKQQEREARAGALDNINNFVDSIRPKGSANQEALADLKKRFTELYEAGKKLGLGNHELTRLTKEYEAAQARLKAEFEAQQQTFRDGLEIRALEAKGQTEAAAAARTAMAAEAELKAAQKEGYDFLSIERLKEVQALEAEADAKKRATQAAEALRQLEERRAATLDDLVSRELRLAGNTVGADSAAAEGQARAQLRAAKEQLDAGTLTEELYRRLTAVINGELNKALTDLTSQAAAAAEAAAAQAAAEAEARAAAVADLRSSIEIRELRQRGLEAEAIAAEAAITRAEELAQARAAGGTEADLERLAAVLDEDLREALERLTDAAVTKAEELRNAERDFGADLESQLLRATGQTSEADRLDLENRQAATLAEAISKGFGADTIKLLEKVQAAQRSQLLAEQQAKLATPQGPLGSPNDRSAVAEVRTITAGQADSMIGYLAAIAAYTRAMAGGTAGGITAGDRAIGAATARANQAAGVRPEI